MCITIAAALITVAVTAPDPQHGIAECARQRGDMVRLDCFDRLSRRLGLGAEQQAVSKAGKWRVSSGTSAVDDSATLIAQLTADGKIEGWPNAKKVRPMLIMQCDQEHLDIYVYTGMVAKGARTAITHRLDRSKAVTQEWDNADSGDAVFYNPMFGDETTRFVAALATHRTMFFQLTPHNAAPTATTFSLHGLGEIVPKLRLACPSAWK